MSAPTRSFAGKNVIITGGTRGIGRGLVEAFSRAGARVIFTYKTNDQLARELEWGIRQAGGQAQGFNVDVADADAIERWKEQVLEKIETIDVLINNAGIIRDKALAMMSRQDWEEVINTNLHGVYNVTRSFIVTFMKQRQGNIINMSSVSGIIGTPRQTNYAASKGAIIAFSKSLSREAAPYGVRVNVIAPGFIDTDMTRGLKEDHIAQLKTMIPMARFGTAEEVSKLALFLASDAASYITGQVIRVDGGMSMS